MSPHVLGMLPSHLPSPALNYSRQASQFEAQKTIRMEDGIHSTPKSSVPKVLMAEVQQFMYVIHYILLRLLQRCWKIDTANFSVECALWI